jgi:serine beta-lactamase-like protein LACTB
MGSSSSFKFVHRVYRVDIQCQGNNKFVYFQAVAHTAQIHLEMNHLLLCTLLTFVAPIKEDTAIQQAVKMCEAFISSGNAHGVQLAVRKNGRLVFSKGFGLANVEKNIPVTDSTLFKVGSISKALTSAALVRLAADGRLNLDASVRKYVPSFPPKKYDFSTRQLAGHLAGIRHYHINSEEAHYKDVIRTKHYPSSTAALEVFRDDTLLFRPGSQYHYSSFGWSLIGAVIEGASGQSYLNYMQQHIWRPLNMQHTCGNVTDSIIPNRAEGYDAGGKVSATGDPSYNYPGAGLLSSAADLTLYSEQLLYGSYFKRDLVKSLFSSQQTADGKPTGYGMGWNILKDKNGHTVYFHRGALLDGSGYLVLYPDDQVEIAFLTNSPQADKLGIQELGALFYRK